jgi:hypothetical protein
VRLLRAHGDRHDGPVGALDPSNDILDATVTFDPINDASDATISSDPGNNATVAFPRRNVTDAPRLTDAPRPRFADAS